jgi:hypothetical protein
MRAPAPAFVPGQVEVVFKVQDIFPQKVLV